ncbi:hypothetical protein [Clostridium oryzae]|uniref:Uncharacterized protein n=1 Tax=Clostridium oryzae TaxID=1450648 RepID=A0A1V4IQM8_9CLOT|nr:hypothetical protein [Clostridium oryzae]OPJ62114.1 hypothetical protein CLORY_19370 [Clostridium oryzae]
MKKKIIAMTLIALLAVPTAAYAKTSKTNPKAAAKVTSLSKSSSKSKKEAVKVSKQKQQLKEELTTMKANVKKFVDLKKKVNAKKAELNKIMGAIKEGTKTLPADQLTALNAKIKAISAAYKDATDTASVDSEAKKAEAKSKGTQYSSAITAIDKVIAKQNSKVAKLTKLIGLYDDALTIARTATVVSEDETNTTTPTDETTPADTTTSAGTVVTP